MNILRRIAKASFPFFSIVAVLILLGTIAQAQVSLNSIRVTAADPISTAQFYQQAFGLKEVNRLNLGNDFVEIFLNFGTSEAMAAANSSAQVVIMQSESNADIDAVAHLIFTVTDINATAAAITAAGGTMDRPPFEFGDTGIFLGMGQDPAGNHLELIQQP